MQVVIEKILDGVPEVSDYFKDRIDDIPEKYREQIADGIKSLLKVLEGPTKYIARVHLAILLAHNRPLDSLVIYKVLIERSSLFLLYALLLYIKNQLSSV